MQIMVTFERESVQLGGLSWDMFSIFFSFHKSKMDAQELFSYMEFSTPYFKKVNLRNMSAS